MSQLFTSCSPKVERPKGLAAALSSGWTQRVRLVCRSWRILSSTLRGVSTQLSIAVGDRTWELVDVAVDNGGGRRS